MKFLLLLVLPVLTALTNTAIAEVKVTVSIAPLHSLVATVMEGIGKPTLLVPGSQSPHHFQLKPSAARNLQEADVIVWIGPSLESSLARPINTLGKSSVVVTFIDLPGLLKLPLRQLSLVDGHSHQHDDESSHLPQMASNDATSKSIDPHLWLNPENAMVLVEHLAKTLSQADPINAERYNSNARNLKARISKLSMQLQATLYSVEHKPFLVLHDAFHYYENRFKLHSAGSIMSATALPPGAARVDTVIKLIESKNIRCILKEPQLPARILQSIKSKGTTLINVDPLGSTIEPGPHFYEELLQTITNAFLECLQA